MAAQKRLIIVSGLSGSGKSVALHVLEDIGYYCIDNLPASLLESAVDEVAGIDQKQGLQLAVGIDARNPRQNLEALPGLVAGFRERDIMTEALFLAADDETLLRRYSESRRRHPLAEEGAALRSAILEERDVQIRGYPVRFDIDLLILFSANPATYNRSGKVIPQLKDRIGSVVHTHYPYQRPLGIEII